MIKFDVNTKIKPETEEIEDCTFIDAKISLEKILNKKPEATSNCPKICVRNYTNNRFVGMIHRAYSEHYPITISPDDIWLCISQGFARHITQNSEEFRRRFVEYEGQEIIRVIRNKFIKNSPDNDWQSVFSEFAAKIEEYVGKVKNLIVADFSTTGDIEKAASQIVLMDIMKQYFDYRVMDYRVMTTRGIPSIQLTGTIDDWKSIKQRISVFKEFDLNWWIDKLEPVIDQFISAFEGNIDQNFWESLYKHVDHGSGGPHITGWINTLFPYIIKHDQTIIKNYDMTGQYEKKEINKYSMSTANFPSGLSKVPFVWEHYENDINMNFIAGHIGYVQEADLSLKSIIGWAIVEKEKVTKTIINNLKANDYGRSKRSK